MIEKFSPLEEGSPVSPVEEERELVEIQNLFQGLKTHVMPEVESGIQEIGQLETVLKSIPQQKNSPENREHLREIDGKITRFVNKLIFVASLCGFIGGIKHMRAVENSQMMEQTSTDSIKESASAEGIEFTHSDSITTHMIDYLSGRDTLSENEVEDMFRNIWKKMIADKNVDIPENFDRMSPQEITNFIAQRDTIEKFRLERYPDMPEAVFQKSNASVYLRDYREFPRFLGYREEIYKALWQILSEVGSPKIRLQESDPSLMLATNRLGSYHPHTNTVTISIRGSLAYHDEGKEITSDSRLAYPLFGELAHAEQQHLQPQETDEQFTRDREQILNRSDSLKISVDSAQKYQYSIPGSVEHEAHSVIEPRLKERFKHLVEMLGQKNPETEE